MELECFNDSHLDTPKALFHAAKTGVTDHSWVTLPLQLHCPGYDNGFLVACISVCFVICVINRAVMQRNFDSISRQQSWNKQPPKLPQWIPVIGFIPLMLSYLFSNPLELIMKSRIFRMPDPIRLSILSKDVYIVQGAENIMHVFRNSWTSTSTVIHKFSLRNAFGMSEKALDIYDKDNSGGSLRPYPGSTVEARNRVDFKTYQNIARFLAGSGFAPFWRRYHTDVTRRLKGHTLGSEWEHWPDFLGFFETEISTATVNALCGKYLLKRSPNFLKDFWKMDREAGVLFKGTPRIFAPKVYATRDRLLAAIKDWQAFARQNFLPSTVEPNGDDPFWGSSFFRDRQGVFMDMDGMDYDAVASEDFGAIWASVCNAIVAAFWTTLEIFQDPELLARVREELKVCRNGDPDTLFDIDILLHSPLIQSIYAEVLRLRVHVFIVRAPKKYSLKIRNWLIPTGKTLIMSSTPAHMDKDVWNTGASDEHGLDTFWAERFMKAAGDESSGPRKHKMQAKSPSTSVHGPHTTSQAKFAPEDVEGSWIPYGGGPRMCPGRHFAKREIILTAAMMVTLFDCEVLTDVRSLKMDMKGYGLGTLNAEGKVPVRIKRRNLHRIQNANSLFFPVSPPK